MEKNTLPYLDHFVILKSIQYNLIKMSSPQVLWLMNNESKKSILGFILSLYTFLFPLWLYFLPKNSLSPLFFTTTCHYCWGLMFCNPYFSMNSLWTLIVMVSASSHVVLSTSKIWFYNCRLATKPIKLLATNKLWSYMKRS